MINIGKCPKCNSNMEIRKKEVKGKKVELYACEKAHWKTEDGEFFEITKDSSCDFRIWQNALSRYGYHRLKHNDIRKLLNKEDLIITLKSKKIEYKKYIAIDYNYGVTVLFDIDIEEE